MKVFILAVSVMLIAGLLVGWAGWYVDRLCCDLRALLGELPEESDLQEFGRVYGLFEKRWYEAENLLKWIVGSGKVESVERDFVDMGVRFIGDDKIGYGAAKMHLEQQLNGMCEGERFSWKTIL